MTESGMGALLLYIYNANYCTVSCVPMSRCTRTKRHRLAGQWIARRKVNGGKHVMSG